MTLTLPAHETIRPPVHERGHRQPAASAPRLLARPAAVVPVAPRVRSHRGAAGPITTTTTRSNT